MLTDKLKELYLLPGKAIEFQNYVQSLVYAKRDYNNLTWQDIADLVEIQTGINHSRHWYARNFGDILLMPASSDIVDVPVYDEIEEEEAEPSIEDDIAEKLLELKKERVKIQDEMNQNRAYVRRLAREDTLKEIALEAAKIMGSKKLLEVSNDDMLVTANEKEAILLLSDWHYGMDINSHWNEFNLDIARRRINDLLFEVIQRCRKEQIDTIHVLNLGDLIAGRIHLPLRIESRIDTITQVMEVSEILAEFLHNLKCNFGFVHYYSCTDNHSRVEPDKTQSIDLESLCRITDWYLEARLESEDVIIHKNKYSEDIITLNVAGHPIIAVHGDKDKPAAAISRLSNFTRHTYDAVLMSHRHHFSADEECGTLVIGNGALMGTDAYAKSLRLHSEPSQTLIFVTPERVADSIVRIVLR